MYLDLDAQSGQWIAANSDRRWALLLEYWNRLAQRRGQLPARTDIDATELPRSLLPNIFLIDVVDENGVKRFRFRLLGAAITARETVRPGMFVDEYIASIPVEMLAQYRACLERKVSVRRTSLAWDHPTKEFIFYHVMLLPLAADGVTIDTMIGLAIYEA